MIYRFKVFIGLFLFFNFLVKVNEWILIGYNMVYNIWWYSIVKKRKILDYFFKIKDRVSD